MVMIVEGLDIFEIRVRCLGAKGYNSKPQRLINTRTLLDCSTNKV